MNAGQKDLFQSRKTFALTEAQKLAWLRLIRSENVGPHTFRALINRYGGAEKALEALPDLSRKGGLKRAIRICPEDVALKEMEAASKIGAALIGMGEEAYPKLLRETYSAPPLIYVLGRTDVLNRPALGIVGSRKSSAVGMEMAAQLAHGLSAKGYLVVSGLARGVDGAAHRASLEGGTVAVIAGGPDNIYPPEHKELAEAIKNDGAIIAEMGPGYQTRAQDFPRRNRIIAGMSLGVIVVEAALRSGSLITARQALEENRQVFAVPGSPLDPRAAGTNRLIREGAILTRDAEDILAEIEGPLSGANFSAPLGDNGFTLAPEPSPEEPDEDARARVKSLLSVSPITIDQLIAVTGFGAGTVQGALLELEIAGELERQPGQRIALKPR